MARYDLPISFIQDHGNHFKSIPSMRPPLSNAKAPHVSVSSMMALVIDKLWFAPVCPKVEVLLALKLLSIICSNLHLCMKGNRHLAFAFLLVIKWATLYVNCSSLLEQYLSSLVLFLQNPFESDVMFERMPLPLVIRPVPRLFLIFDGDSYSTSSKQMT